jgi:hypothetical protein
MAWFRAWPRCAPAGIVITLLFAALSAGAALHGAWIACGVLNFMALLLMMRVFKECSSAMASVAYVLQAGENRRA